MASSGRSKWVPARESQVKQPNFTPGQRKLEVAFLQARQRLQKLVDKSDVLVIPRRIGENDEKSQAAVPPPEHTKPFQINNS